MINKKTRFQLYDKFRQGAIPSGADFAELIRANINILDDGIDIPDDTALPIKIRGRADEGHLFDLCDHQWIPQWRISQASYDGQQFGFNLSANNQSRVFVERESGNVGLSVEQPTARLHISQVSNQDSLRIDDEAGDINPFMIDSTGAVGVGTLVPGAKLHIINPTASDSFRVEDQQDPGAAADDTPFVIKNDGKVGIGFVNPGAKVAVRGGLNIGGSADPGDSNALIQGRLRVKSDVWLGDGDSQKVVLPGTLQSVDEPGQSTALVVNDSLDVRQNLAVGGDAEFGSGLDDSLIARGSLVVKKDLTVNHDADIANQLTVEGEALIKQDLNADNNVNIAKQLNVNGNVRLGDAATDTVTIKGSAVVEQNLSVSNDVSIIGNLTVQGDVTARDTQHVEGDVTLGNEDGDTITIEGKLVSGHSSGQLQIVDALTIAESLTVNANVTLGNDNNHTVSIKGQLVSGHSSGQLHIDDAVTIAEPLTVNANVTLGDDNNHTVTIKGKLVSGHSSGQLHIDDAVTIAEPLTVKANTTLGNKNADVVTIRGVLISGHSTGQLQINDGVTVKETLRANADSYLGDSATDKVVLPGTLQSSSSPTDSTALVVNDGLKVKKNLAIEQNLSIKGAVVSANPGGKLELNDAVHVAQSLTVGSGTVLNDTLQVGKRLNLGSDIKLAGSTVINEFSTDTSLGGNSHSALPTEKAVKAYVDQKATSLQDYVHDTLPTGAIIMWSGSTIPTGWALCDGKDSRPNLLDRFIIGAGKNYKTGDWGGQNSVTLSVEQMPGHTHNVADTGHTHVLTDSEHSHAIDDPGHSHSVDLDDSSGSGGIDDAGESSEGNADTFKAETGITIEPASSNIGIKTGQAVINESSMGGGQPFSIIPPYYALSFIIKISSGS